MTDFVNNWNNELLTTPVAPLGLIAMPGCEEMGKLVTGHHREPVRLPRQAGQRLADEMA